MRTTNFMVLLLALSAISTPVAEAHIITYLSEGWSLASTCNAIASMTNISIPSTIIAAQIQNEMRKPIADRQLPYSDPFHGKNVQLFDPSLYQQCPFEYQTIADLPAIEGQAAITLLRLNGVNYRANVSVDGTVVLGQQSIVGGIRRYTVDITKAIASGRHQHLGQRLGGLHAELPPPPKKNLMDASPLTLTVSISPPVDPRGTDLSFSFLDWDPLPADFSGGLWRDVSVLQLTHGFTFGGGPLLYFWSDGFSVITTLGSGGTNISSASVEIDVAVQCYPADACQALVGNDTLQGLIASAVTIQTDYPTPVLALVTGCRISTPFDLSPSKSASAAVAEVDGQSLVEGRVVCTVGHVESPLLWYPYRRANVVGATDLPSTFKLTVGVTDPSDSTFFPISETKPFGLRQLASNVSTEGSRQLFINNEFILVAGAGWSPDMFLRIDDRASDKGKLLRQLELVRHMGVNTIRLEGKWEDEAFFVLCDQLGIMVIPGIECCSSWQNWNLWNDTMTEIARVSVKGQLRRLASHPSVIAFLGSSDEIPPAAVEQIYDQLYLEERWSGAVIAAACAGSSSVSGPTGVKMSGPYSWVPPSYFLANSDGNQYPLGGGWGFLTEGGPGEAPMTYNSMKITLPAEHLWEPEAGGSLSDWWDAHAGLPRGKFGTLRRFTPPLNARLGEPSSASEYLFKAQLMNYEGIRAMYEAYTRNKIYNATGVVQWMLNNAYPSNVWHLYDYYLIGGGGYYASRKALQPIHMVLSYVDGSVALVSNDYHKHFGANPAPLSAEWIVYRLPSAADAGTSGPQVIAIGGPEYFDVSAFSHNTVVFMEQKIDFATINSQLGINETYLVRLVFTIEDRSGPAPMKREEDNWYWLSTTMDIVNWAYDGPDPNLWTDCTQWANFSSLAQSLGAASLAVNFTSKPPPAGSDKALYEVTVTNTGPTIAFFVQLAAYAPSGLEIGPSFWDDNYITLLPGQSTTLVLATLAMEDYTNAPVVLDKIEAVSYNDIVAAAKH